MVNHGSHVAKRCAIFVEECLTRSESFTVEREAPLYPSSYIYRSRRCSTDTVVEMSSTGRSKNDENSAALELPTNPLVTALLTDLYQITMAYAYWKTNRHDEPAVFELFFRKNPFKGEYTIFCGLDECLKFISHFRFTTSDIEYLQHRVPSLSHCDPEFFTWMGKIDASCIRVRAMQQGTVCFPRIPLMIIEGPLAVAQLLETTLLTLVNYPSLLATNAVRMVRAAHAKTGSRRIGNKRQLVSPNKGTHSDVGDEDELSDEPRQCSKRPECIEFGLRRAQGPDGGLTASKYAIVGGFVGTSNVQAGKLFDLHVAGTHAHAFVQSYSSLDTVATYSVASIKGNNNGDTVQLLPRVLEYRKKLGETVSHAYETTNDGELGSFIAYAAAFPRAFLCLIDTYDTLQSGLLNFIMVAMVLDDLGYKPIGIRLDSGDLAYLSLECAKAFASFAEDRPFMHDLDVVASNDINETTLRSLNEQHHAITLYGIGTNLVTCQAQPALGCVYKLVDIGGKPRIKLSQEIEKVVIPGKKRAFRLYGKDGDPLLDILLGEDEPDPMAGQRLMCRHPFQAHKRVAVTPNRVECLHEVVFENGKVTSEARSLIESQIAVQEQLTSFRSDILLYENPTPYKVSVSDKIFDFLHKLWQNETPVKELS